MGGQFTAGMLLAFQGLLSAFMAPVNSLVNLGQTIQETRTEMERVQDVLNYKADVPEGPEDSSETSVQAMGKLTGAIDVKDLTFGYSPLEKPIIENLNLHAEPGQWIALVGGSGSGKSTLLRLLLGFEKPDRGAIYFGGQDINDLDAQTPPGDCRSCYDVLADRIVMLDKGCIIEEGTYDELVAANGEFAELVRRQQLEGA